MYSIIIISVVSFYVWFAIWTFKKAIGRCSNQRSKQIVGTIIILTFLLIPTGDEIAGRLYFNHLCATEAMVNVYQTIELPPDNWDVTGKPKFYDEKNGNFFLNWDDLVDADMIKTNKIFNITKLKSIMKDKSSGKVIREKVWFGFKGGWLKKNFSPTPAGSSCGRSLASTLSEYAELFKPSSKHEGVSNDNSE